METVIPFVKRIFATKASEKKEGKGKYIPDVILAEYESFDDYLEMVVQFGVSSGNVCGYVCSYCVCSLVPRLFLIE